MYVHGYHYCRVRCWIRLAVAVAAGLLFLTAAGLVAEVAISPGTPYTWHQPTVPDLVSGDAPAGR